MKNFFSYKKIGSSNKRLILIFILLLILIIIYFFGIEPGIEYIKRSEEEIILKRIALEKYEEYLKSRKPIEDEINLLQGYYDGIQKRLIPGETPQLCLANLQEIIKRLSEKSGIAIRSFRTLELKETPFFKKISIHVEINPTNSMLNLGQFIHEIEHYEKELVISEMELMVLNPRVPNNIQGSFIISGFIKGEKPKEKGRGEKG